MAHSLRWRRRRVEPTAGSQPLAGHADGARSAAIAGNTAGTEQADGITLEFATDRILIDTNTPADEPSGGGFGNALLRTDGTLITSFSYRDSAGVTHAGVAKWELLL